MRKIRHFVKSAIIIVNYVLYPHELQHLQSNTYTIIPTLHHIFSSLRCNLCDREFSQSTHRRTHMKEAHGDERKFQCHLCSKCFKRKEHLDKHLVFHGNER